MRRAFIVSLLFHGGIAGLIFGLSRSERELPTAATPVTVEIVADAAPAAAAPSPEPPRPPPAEAAPQPPRQAAAPPPAPKAEPKVAAKPPPSPPPPPPAPPAPVVEAKPPPPTAPSTEPAPAPESPAPVERAEVRPSPPRPQLRKPEPAEPTESKPEPRRETATVEPKPERPTPPTPASAPEDFDALLRSVEAQNKRVRAPETRAGTGVGAAAGGSSRPGEAPSAQVNPSALVAAISQQVTRCWNIPIAAQGVGNLRAELAIELGPDGGVQTVAPTDSARMQSDPVFRAFAESAVRAVRSCSPLKLPPESYQVWRNVIFNFEPSMMAG